ncbi:hypothetical protein C0993_008319, partial [Termitomyces sp. T159_Od127]
SAALVLHNREQYGQGKWTLDEYIDFFWALVEQVAYPDGLQLCLTFQDGLHSALMEHINNLAEGRLDDEQIASWYKVAQDQWQLMEIQPELCWMHTTHCSTPMVTFQHPASLHSVPALALAAPTPQPLSLGILMNVDATQQHHPALLLLHYLFTAEQEELLLQLLAAKDAARAPLPDEPGPELALKESDACAPLLGLEEDF